LLIEEDADNNRDHLKWLGSPEASDEEDRDQQIAQSERQIELARMAHEHLG
jgi:hypothetical protein